MNLPRYSISDLEKLTGIKAHTIRMWEKRYQIFSPERSESNIRSYSVADLQRLLNIAFLNKHGFKISMISSMNEEDMQANISRLSQVQGSEEGSFADLIKASSELNEDLFEKNINGSILKLGFEHAFHQVVFPFLDKINLLWQIGKINSCQERFVNNLVRHKLVVAIDGMTGHTTRSNEQYLLYMPAGHYDETNLLYANYVLRKAGHSVIYLGPSIPLEHLRSLAGRQVVTRIVVSINHGFTERELAAYTEKLLDIFPDVKVYLLSIGTEHVRPQSPRIDVISSYQSMDEGIIG
jgi:DNA-binding transcriptional MerR regulator